MDYILKPSTEKQELVKKAIELWNQDDIRDLIKKFYFLLFDGNKQKEWQKIEDKVAEKVSQLVLTESLKEKILGFIKPIGLQIIKWRKYHEDFLSARKFIRNSINKIYWTPEGTIDKKKTAQELVKDEGLDVVQLYKLACIYCLEDEIKELWEQVPKRTQEYIYNKGQPSFANEHGLVVFWTYELKGELAKLNDLMEEIKIIEDNEVEYIGDNKVTEGIYQLAFGYAARRGNKAAVEYFLQKLTPKERKECLVKFAGVTAKLRCISMQRNLRSYFPKEYNTEVLCFLLAQMSEEEQVEVFKSYSSEVLECLLDWPYQDFFIETAQRMWGVLPEKDCDYLLRIVINKVLNNYKDYNYQELFRKFWHESPIANRKYVIDKFISGGTLLSKLLKVEDKENISLVLKDVTAAEKEKLISCYEGQNICASLSYNNKWDLLKFFIGECIISQEVMTKFKEEFKERNTWYYSKEQFTKSKDMWDKFFGLLDDFIENFSKKRSIEDEDSSPAKRLCSLEVDQRGCSNYL